jgi:hypothetical protein
MAWSLLKLCRYDGNFFLQALCRSADVFVHLFLMIMVQFHFNYV